MKIIAGEKKGFPLVTPEGITTRPTLTRVRESLFSVIQGDIPGSIFCDLYCGGGTVGLEALSRGAERAIFVESNAPALSCLDRNIQKLGFQKRADIYRTDISTWQAPLTLAPDIVFADPPYREEEINGLSRFLNRTVWKEQTLLIVQLPATLDFTVEKFTHLRSTTYGKTRIEYYLSI